MKMNRRFWAVVLMVITLFTLIAISTVGFAEDSIERTEKEFLKAEHEAQLEKGHIDFWTIEDRYEFEKPWQDMIRARTDDIYRKAVFGLPDENDIMQEEAVKIARTAVEQEYGEGAFAENRTWDRESIYFWDYYTGEHEWQITFYSKENTSKNESIPFYNVRIDAKSGQVNKVDTFSELIKSNPGR